MSVGDRADDERCGAGSSHEAGKPTCCGPSVTSNRPARIPGRRLAAGWLDTSVGRIPRVGTALTWRDKLSTIKVRLGIGRMDYTMDPGVYAVGSPTAKSPVLVTANYKLSFDHLRRHLEGLDAWIMVLDTKGVNVWCAAGKGTFGTEEMVRRIDSTGLAKLVSHRRLIVPQLGAPGICAHEVQRRSGFAVVYGPVRSRDLPVFMKSGRRATPEMRRVHFGLRDRAVLIPVELVQGAKVAIVVAACLAFLAGLGPDGFSLRRMASEGSLTSALLFALFVSAVVLTSLLLPWLPGRAFSVKGAWLGGVLALCLGGSAWAYPAVFGDGLTTAAWLLFGPALTSFVALNFTGSSTYTSLSGVQKETAVAVPIQLACAVAAAGLWVAGRFV
jgi:hypothetical protein